MNLPVTYNLLAPFSYQKWRRYLMILGLIILWVVTIILVSYIVNYFSNGQSGFYGIIIGWAFVTLYLLLRLEDSYINKTSIIGQITFDKDFVIVNNNKYRINEFRRIGLSNNFSGYKTLSPRWKRSYSFEIVDENNDRHIFCISLVLLKTSDPNPKEVFEYIRKTNIEIYKHSADLTRY